MRILPIFFFTSQKKGVFLVANRADFQSTIVIIVEMCFAINAFERSDINHHFFQNS
jgi:hypothetical protein